MRFAYHIIYVRAEIGTVGLSGQLPEFLHARVFEKCPVVSNKNITSGVLIYASSLNKLKAGIFKAPRLAMTPTIATPNPNSKGSKYHIENCG